MMTDDLVSVYILVGNRSVMIEYEKKSRGSLIKDNAQDDFPCTFIMPLDQSIVEAHV